MDLLPPEVLGASAAARERLAGLARDVARNGAAGEAGASLRLAAVAREAIFADALAGALHARLQELKNVSK
jgi:hypothetical protein